jgi:hypothetical protein
MGSGRGPATHGAAGGCARPAVGRCGLIGRRRRRQRRRRRTVRGSTPKTLRPAPFAAMRKVFLSISRRVNDAKTTNARVLVKIAALRGRHAAAGNAAAPLRAPGNNRPKWRCNWTAQHRGQQQCAGARAPAGRGRRAAARAAALGATTARARRRRAGGRRRQGAGRRRLGGQRGAVVGRVGRPRVGGERGEPALPAHLLHLWRLEEAPQRERAPLGHSNPALPFHAAALAFQRGG